MAVGATESSISTAQPQPTASTTTTTTTTTAATTTSTSATSPTNTPKMAGQSLERLANNTPRFHGCSRIGEYEYMCKLGEGTFGEVSKARSKKTGQVVALKKILMHNEKDGFPITALREIKLLKQLDHVNILKLTEMAVERPKNASKKTSMFMVTPYMDHDLAGLLENPSVQFTEAQIKCYMQQLLAGTAYLHANKILHRDMKAANLLINNHGVLQIADFGLARPYDDDPPRRGQGGGEATREYTTLVVTRWYRPPELLLQLRKYTTAIDMWGVGCVFGEMYKRKPILPGTSDLHQAQIIFDLVGSPNHQSMPGWQDLPGVDGNLTFAERTSTLRAVFKDQPPMAVSLLEQLLTLDWRKRINAIDALQHPYFTTPPLPARPGDIPKFDDSHELDRRKFRDQKNKPPPAPAGGSVGIQAQGEWAINGRPGPGDARGGGAYRRHPAAGRSYHHDSASGSRRPQQQQQQLQQLQLQQQQQQAYYDRDRDRERDRDRNGTRHPDYRHHQHQYPPRNYQSQDSRRLPHASYDDPYSRRPQVVPDTSLPARPPPTEVEPLECYRGPPPYRERDPAGDRDRDRDRDHAFPPRSRLPPPLTNAAPQYSNTDHSPSRMMRRPLPRERDDYDYDRDRDRDRERDYAAASMSERMYDDRPSPAPRYNNRRLSRDYDYDAAPPPPVRYNRHSQEYASYDDAPGTAGGGSLGSAERRRSRSPRRQGYEMQYRR